MMNNNIVTSGMHNSIANTITINTSQLTPGMMSDGMSEPSSPDSSFDASDLMGGGPMDDVTSQLAASGPIGIAAAAAIASGRKKKRPHLFETNPSVRKRQQTRLLRKLKCCIEEYTTRVGQQAVVLCCTPCKSTSMNAYKVFGSQPLESVIKNCKNVIMQDLDTALAEQAPPNHDNAGVYDLPTLALDGIPTPVDKMTQAQLRTFIPEMLKYSTGRSKPGWGKLDSRPIWWPNDLPWANVRSDVRTDEEKKRVGWTDALKTIVKNCYRHHGREDLLNIFGDDGAGCSETAAPSGHYAGTMVQTINNPDGTVSIIQIDTGPNSVVTLPDGTQATVVHSMTAIPQETMGGQDGQQTIHTLGGEVAIQSTQPSDHQVTPVSLEMAEGGGQTLSSINAGRLLLSSGESAQITTDPTTGIMTIPVSMYQSLVANQGNSIDLNNTTQIAIAQIQHQQHQLLTQHYEQQQQQQHTEMQTEVLNQELVHQQSQQQQQQDDLQLHVQQLQQQQSAPGLQGSAALQGGGDGQNITVNTVRVVSIEPKDEPS